MKYDKIDYRLYIQNRKNFTAKLKKGAMAIFNSNDIITTSADSTLPFVQHRTQTPIPGTIPDPCPVTLDQETVVKDPFPLLQWLVDHDEELRTKGFKKMFEDGKQKQFNVYVIRGETDVVLTLVFDAGSW